jgi:hypothetical protein
MIIHKLASPVTRVIRRENDGRKKERTKPKREGDYDPPGLPGVRILVHLAISNDKSKSRPAMPGLDVNRQSVTVRAGNLGEIRARARGEHKAKNSVCFLFAMVVVWASSFSTGAP